MSDKRASAWGKPTATMLEEIRKAVGDLREKRVVIHGEGDGRYSLHYAVNEGASVEHVDYSEGAIAGLREAAFANGALRIRPDQPEDQMFFYFDSRGTIAAHNSEAVNHCKFGSMGHLGGVTLVLSSGLMEYLTPDEVRELVRACQNVTLVGGANAIVYLAKGPGVSDILGEHPHEPGFLESLYEKGWKFTYNADATREDRHIIIRPDDTTIDPDRQPETHVHRIMRFVAVKERL